jgi:hypothetical protein
MSDHLERYSCKLCNKKYASTSSLWNHNNKFHKYIVTNDDTITTLNVTKLETKLKIYTCLYCNKKFNYRQNKYQHEKTCKNKDIIFETWKLIQSTNYIEDSDEQPLIDEN